MVKLFKNILIWWGYDKYTCVLSIHWLCNYFYEVVIPFVFGCPELKPSRVSNTDVLVYILADFNLLTCCRRITDRCSW